MSKKKTDAIESDTDVLFLAIAKGCGGEILDDRDKSAWPFIDTGILGLNFILSGKFVGGGIPGGVVVQISGGSSSGKSLIGTNALRGCQSANGIAVMLDAERTLSKAFAVQASHVDPKKFIVVESDTLEGAFNKIHKVIRMVRQEAKVPLDRPLCIIYDSIAVSPSEREFAEVDLDMEEVSKAELKEAGAGADKPGERAKICGKELRKIPPVLAANNVTLVIINQLRSKIGVMFGSPDTDAGGGRALRYYCSIAIKMSGFKQIKDKLGKVVGINVNLLCDKNKVSRPFQELKSLRLFFDKGIDPFGGLLELLKQSGRVEGYKNPETGKVQAGTYKVNEPWAGGQVITFKSSQERNDVPVDLLLKCPALVDATEVSQIEYYTKMFDQALDAVINDIGSEEDVPNEEE